MPYPNRRKGQAFRSLIVLACGFLGLFPQVVQARIAVSFISQTEGATPFIENVTVDIGASGILDRVDYIIAPKADSKTRPYVGSYTGKYLASQGFETGTIVTIPVPFLYAGATNKVKLIFHFTTPRGSEIGIINDTITTSAYYDPCNRLNAPTLQQNRTSRSDLNFDFFLLKNSCSSDFPVILDTDANVRWVGTSKIASQSAIVFNNGVYTSDGASGVIRTEFDGQFKKIGDYAASNGVTYTGHHNYDRGRDGIILEVNTTTQTESVNLEIDGKTGAVLNTWDLGQIISDAMSAGGDDPTQFVYPVGTDWFHNNAATYNKADNSLIVSSRENFVIAVDYDTPQDGIKKIHWILGDTTKHWYQFLSLQKFALTLAPETTAPAGQHAVSIDHNGNLMMFDDGEVSYFQQPAGVSRSYSAGRIYSIDTSTMTAREVFTYAPEDKRSAICGSFYEGAPGNYLIDYAVQNNYATTEIQGIGGSKKVVFDLQYPTAAFCSAGWNAIPIERHDIRHHDDDDNRHHNADGDQYHDGDRDQHHECENDRLEKCTGR
jgi:hypothetical protein